jgi:NADH:ubiquinone oxidoreductase subunit F (NADH-binding)
VPENKIVLKNIGIIDPNDINTYINRDGFKALQQAHKMTPEQVISEIKSSDLRGRGGAGFPTGIKWEMVRQASGDEKYIICNADEGEVGTFKDRYILAGDPFSLIEAIAIAGYATGAKYGFIYLRAEYRYMVNLIQKAIEQSRLSGYLNEMDIKIRLGAGAYICGEESALMESIEGKRGMVRYRPPFPPQKGLWGKPTVINNVETLMNIPQIILNGADWFNKTGTKASKGTKVFSVAGDVGKPGVYEVELGTPLRELVEGLAQAEKAKVIQIGGATGRLLPASSLDTPLAFENVLGAGAVTIFNEDRDVIDIVYQTLKFLAEESCGKCNPCRLGTKALKEIIYKFVESKATEEDIKVLCDLSGTMTLSSLCGLGQAAPNPVMDSLQHFRDAFDRRIQRAQEVKIK